MLPSLVPRAGAVPPLAQPAGWRNLYYSEVKLPPSPQTFGEYIATAWDLITGTTLVSLVRNAGVCEGVPETYSKLKVRRASAIRVSPPGFDLELLWETDLTRGAAVRYHYPHYLGREPDDCATFARQRADDSLAALAEIACSPEAAARGRRPALFCDTLGGPPGEEIVMPPGIDEATWFWAVLAWSGSSICGSGPDPDKPRITVLNLDLDVRQFLDDLPEWLRIVLDDMQISHYEADAPIVVVTIDRPEVANAIDRPTADALVDAFRRFDADGSLSVAVLAGAHGKFCCGADLKAMRSGDPSRITRVALEGDGPVGPTRMLLRKPVIAAVEGHAVAGGLELAAWCDLRVAAEDAVFGVFCRRWGIPLMDGGTIRLARLIGHSHALDLILTGRGVSGEEALRMGLANRLVPPGRALAEALALAREIAALPQAALRSDRLSSYEQWSLGLAEALAGEYHHGMATLATGEMVGGLERYASGTWRGGRSP